MLSGMLDQGIVANPDGNMAEMRQEGV